jgi:hypothetical protein
VSPLAARTMAARREASLITECPRPLKMCQVDKIKLGCPCQ